MPLEFLFCSSTLISSVSPLAGCKALTTLNVTNTQVTAADVEALQKALPNCKVEWEDRTKPATSPSAVAAPLPAKASFDAADAKSHQVAWAKHLGTKVETTNSVGAKMILIPPGEFLMGSTDEQIETAVKIGMDVKGSEEDLDLIRKDLNLMRKAERPQHRVVLAEPYWLSATEVTVGQFSRFANSDPSFTTDDKDAKKKNSLDWQSPGYSVTDDSAVSQVTWNNACGFCNWLSSREKFKGWYVPDGKGSWVVTPEGNGYRLPTEAEWEYACRAGTTTQYSFGDEVGQLDKDGWYNGNSGINATHTVGLKSPNPFGLYDMHGNMWEWCQDWYDERWYAQSASNAPNGPPGGPSRVFRGGGWGNTPLYIRSAYRSNSPPSGRNYYIGFRVVRVLDVPPVTARVATNATIPAVSPVVPAKLITDINDPTFQQWMKDVAALPAEKQVEAVSQKLVKLNLGFDGKLMGANGKSPPTIENDVVTKVNIFTDKVTDISPLRAFDKLNLLRCFGDETQGKLIDLSPLDGMQLMKLDCHNTFVEDLSPLQGMPLIELNIRSTKVSHAGVAALQKALPNCKIEWDDPAEPAAPAPSASDTK